MAGAMQSEYKADNTAISELNSWIQDYFPLSHPGWQVKLYVDDKGMLIEIANKIDKRLGMSIDVEKDIETNINRVVMLWSLPNVGPDKCAIFELAKLIEDQLVHAGAKSVFCPVRSMMP